MTYKDIINRFRNVVSDHYILEDFGYGQLSDLKTQSQLGPEEQGVDYPYLFLLPGSHNRQGPVMNYSFNMIVMDMARPEEGDVYDNYISIQSDCQQYIDDVLGQLYYAYKDQPEVTLTGISYTPFKEKYQDDLAGMTATITIQVPAPINNCIAPTAPPSELYVSVFSDAQQLVGQDPGENKAFSYPTVRSDVDNSWYINRFTAQQPLTMNVETEFTFQFVKDDVSDTYPAPPQLRYFPAAGGQEYIPANSTEGWPETPEEGVTYTIKQNWYNLSRNTGDFEFHYMEDLPGGEANLLVEPNATLKITKIG